MKPKKKLELCCILRGWGFRGREAPVDYTGIGSTHLGYRDRGFRPYLNPRRALRKEGPR